MPDNQTEKINRFILIRKELKLKQDEIAFKLGINRANLSAIENRRENRKLPNGTKYILEKEYNVNPEWFETGVGEMFLQTGENKPDKVDRQTVEVTGHKLVTGNIIGSTSDYKAKNSVPVFDSVTTAGELEVYADTEREGPAFYVSIPQFADCKFGKLIYGHSMYPTITTGSYIFCKPVTEKVRFVPGEIYFVEYDNFAVCKRLQKGDNPGEVKLVSDNDELRNDGSRRYETYTIKIDEIRQLFLVKGFLNQNHN